MDEEKKKQFNISQWFIRTLAIFASTLAVIDLLKQEYQLSIMLGAAWVLIVIAEQRIKTNSNESG